jgi:hypothetical protein
MTENIPIAKWLNMEADIIKDTIITDAINDIYLE